MWKQYKDTDYYLSPDGRIIRRYKKCDKPLKGYMHYRRNSRSGEYYVFKAYGSEVVLARAMWETYKGEIPKGYKGWLIFLDEINSASKAVQAAAQEGPSKS